MSTVNDPQTLPATFGQIDIYLFDQLLKGRITARDRVLDAGCGSGRNVFYLLKMGCQVSAIDTNPAAVDGIRALAAELGTGLPAANFRVEPVEDASFPDASFDVVISSAVLHFARDDAHFEAMVKAMWRVLRPGGMLFARLASTVAIEDQIRPLGRGRYQLPDGSDRYLVTADALEALTRSLGGDLLDPIKTTVVHGQRSMTTWVVRKA
jgi:SAM-dependent methyltransferase